MLADELGATFLFESLSEEQRHTLVRLGTEVRFDAGETIFVEGQPAEFLWVLLAGEMELLRHIGGQRIRIATASRPGTYGGGVAAFSGSAVASGYRATTKALQPSRFFRLPSSDLGRLLADWSPVAKHLLDGYLQRLESIEATVRERERLISLGRLAAGLAHEVNNPAAAAIRATADLRAAMDQLRVSSVGLPARAYQRIDYVVC
jgi:CRP-like cAMP-binding protein